MRVPVKLLGFSFWLLFLNCAQCQECRREDIKYENTEQVSKASYTDGETVKVNCMTGYIGMYRLKCENGEWTKSIVRPCAKKKCGNPGDTPNGEFELTDGTEFVFGATVVYTCKKGYEMASRIKHRTCRTQGWDNAVPVCEAVRCPVIRTVGDVTASGNTEEGNYGNVIHFECVSSEKKIDGSSDIHCKETGEWSDVVPKCIDITCPEPVIPNGYVVEPLPEYQKDAILKYRCNPGFKKREGIPKCAKFGWTLIPECDEVTCELKSITFEVKKIQPEGKTIFRAGESVEITCSEKSWFIFTKETRKSFTCQDDGEWDHTPVCEEIRCEFPRDQHVYRPYNSFRGDMKLEAIKSYDCESGYRKTEKVATCTRDGWTPKPLCAEIRCEVPHDQHVLNPYGYFRGHMKFQAKKSYYCESGYRKTAEVATCTQDGWTPKPLCAEVTCELKSTTFGIDRIKPEGKTIFRARQSVEITCSKKHWFTFTKETSRSFVCQDNGEWDHTPVCEEIRCEVPDDKHVSSPKCYFSGDMKLEEIKSYDCESGYRKTAEVATCTRDGWTPKPLCAEVTCELKSTTFGIDRIKPKGRTIFRAGQSVEITCSKKHWFTFTKETSRSFTCQDNGEWDHTPVCEEKMCAAPNISNAQIECQPLKYNISSRIEYKCRPGFEPEQPVQITCDSQGRWTGIQQCTEKQNCLNLTIINGFIYSHSSNKKETFYSCNRGYKPFTGNWWDSVTCSNGSLSNETHCIPEEECGALPSVHHGKLKKIPQDSQTVKVECDPGFISDSSFIKCINGSWEIPVCKVGVNCGIPPRVEKGGITSKPKEFYLDGSSVTYVCQSSVLSEESVVFCRNGEWEKLPSCEGQKDRQDVKNNPKRNRDVNEDAEIY